MPDGDADALQGGPSGPVLADEGSAAEAERHRGSKADLRPPPAETGLLSQVFSWQAKVVLTGLILLATWQWHKAPIGIQLGWALQFGLLLAVSIVASCWLFFGIINLAIASLSFAVSYRRPKTMPESVPPIWGFRDHLTWANRLVEHVELLATWIAVALVCTHSLLWQVAGLVVIALWGMPLIDEVARVARLSRDGHAGPPAVGRGERMLQHLGRLVRAFYQEARRLGRIIWDSEPAAADQVGVFKDRRLFVYIATLIGLLVLVRQAPDQWRAALPLVLAVLAGLIFRVARYLRRRKLERDHEDFLAYRNRIAELHYRKSKTTAWFGPVVTVVAFGVVLGLSQRERNQLKAAANDENDGPPPPTDRCVAEPGGPESADIAAFLLGDTHVHELAGYRFPGQMEVADSIMPVSRRPVELDLLSSAPIVHFQRVYDRLQSERDEKQDKLKARPPLQPPLWAHLGDFANLSCKGEMVRALGLLRHFSDRRPSLAGFIPGSHDMSFQGNFDWSPYWRRACALSGMDKAVLDPMLKTVMEDAHVSVMHVMETHGFDWGRLAWGRPLARFAITPLGELPRDRQGGKRRGVLGIFFDTTDRGRGNSGIAGAFGTFSDEQAEKIRGAVQELRNKHRNEAWEDPWFVLLGHSPYAELTAPSRKTLAGLIADLDSGPGGKKDEPRVLALLAAHVHTAGSHRHCIANRLIREIVIGSTLDPPQQAALLEIGLDKRGHAAVRVSTLPTVERPGFTSGPTGAVAATTCRSVVGQLASEPACADLLEGWSAPDFGAATCEELERPLSLREKLRGIAIHGGPDDPEALEDADSKRGRVLLQCLCRDSKQPPAGCQAAVTWPLLDHLTAPVVEELARRPDRAEELTCLAWAASAVQAHKGSGMGMAQALRCAYDDPTFPPAQVTTTSSEEVPCY